ncbi:MAG: hypothetical protein ACI9ZH_000832 [Paracoccaceae bacterium]|jgi:hypothetical protein
MNSLKNFTSRGLENFLFLLNLVDKITLAAQHKLQWAVFSAVERDQRRDPPDRSKGRAQNDHSA